MHRKREWPYFFILAVLLGLSYSLPANAGYLEHKGCREYILDLSDGGWLLITAGTENFYVSKFYVSKNTGFLTMENLYISVYPVNRPLIMGKYIKVNDKTVEILFHSSDENVIMPVEAGELRVINTGRAIITISAEDNHVYIPVNVVAFPVSLGMKAEEVIMTIGLPDREAKEGGFFYWQYKNYPWMSLKLEARSREVQRIRNDSWLVAYKEWAKTNETNISIDAEPSGALVASGMPPVYPKDAWNEGVEGEVGLLVFVNANGKAASVEVTKPSGDARLDEVARRTLLERWEFGAFGKPYRLFVVVTFQGGKVSIRFEEGGIHLQD